LAWDASGSEALKEIEKELSLVIGEGSASSV
jgi:hypothetical protein